MPYDIIVKANGAGTVGAKHTVFVPIKEPVKPEELDAFKQEVVARLLENQEAPGSSDSGAAVTW
jgi:hypothetical protein